MDAIGMMQSGNLLGAFAYLGFSFFVGYSMGFASKKVLMVAVFIMGVFFSGVLLLQYQGIIGGVDWNVMDDKYRGFMVWLMPTLQAFGAFAVAQIPTAVSGGAGLYMGFRK